MKFYVFNTSSDKASVNYSLSLGLWTLNVNLQYEKPVDSVRSTGRSIGVDFEFHRSDRGNPDRFQLWYTHKQNVSKQ